MNYVYVLKNSSYEAYVVKIGKTTQNPTVRASQLYWGATGVPEHFDVAFVCAVPDCNIAESKIHKVLSSYRRNNRREFFHLPLETAKKAVLSICIDLFGSEHVKIVVDLTGEQVLDEGADEELKDIEESEGTITISSNMLSKLIKSPVNTSRLTEFQKTRIAVINEVFQEVFPCTAENAYENFSRDNNPDREIKIWESMAKAFMKVSTSSYVSEDVKEEAYSLLLLRSQMKTSEVLEQITPVAMGDKQAKSLLKAYELKPKPVRVVKVA
ncbi:GIY-YIG nuclease family protein [Vibrio cyclitrophicus]|nr:GIY-YIG nuclease family protein [Vibrio cyclitrophicus]UPR49868.1 GIY-YIG nuclease family protein [Vibrio cyclitrophicus]